MPKDLDVIVVGSGAGRATFAYACARMGKRHIDPLYSHVLYALRLPLTGGSSSLV